MRCLNVLISTSAPTLQPQIEKFIMQKTHRDILKRMAYAIFRIACAVCILFITSTLTKGETVSQKEAMEKAQLFFDQAFGEKSAPVKYIYNGKRLTTARLFTPFYVYNHPRGGFVIISAENKTFPILAYSLKSIFDPNQLTPGEQGWLKGYALDIELIRYDSRVPEQAIRAWQDYPHYIDSILKAPYYATDPKIAIEDSEEVLTELLFTPDDSQDGNFSAVYSPDQWQSIVNDELASKESIPIGIVDLQKNLTPGVLYGRKGDYYRIRFDRLNDWFLRLMPAEYFGERQIASFSAPPYRHEEEPEEPPFIFADEIREFMRSQSRDVESENNFNEFSHFVNDAVVKSAGGGHFDILLPENVRLAMLYNMNGSHIGRATYQSTPMAHIDIEAEPKGFYIAVIFGESGKPYSFKLYR